MPQGGNTSKPIKNVTTAYGVGPETLRNCHEGRQRRQATRPLALSRTNPALNLTNSGAQSFKYSEVKYREAKRRHRGGSDGLGASPAEGARA